MSQTLAQVAFCVFALGFAGAFIYVAIDARKDNKGLSFICLIGATVLALLIAIFTFEVIR